eukprot:GHRR01018912.1.p1 GENE.GHRR01018912.1~~GHRR01018912.1.p1  ORF type:complete len:178 (-),score=36.95 GHRR01018912.1:279-812(-)
MSQDGVCSIHPFHQVTCINITAQWHCSRCIWPCQAADGLQHCNHTSHELQIGRNLRVKARQQGAIYQFTILTVVPDENKMLLYAPASAMCGKAHPAPGPPASAKARKCCHVMSPSRNLACTGEAELLPAAVPAAVLLTVADTTMAVGTLALPVTLEYRGNTLPPRSRMSCTVQQHNK